MLPLLYSTFSSCSSHIVNTFFIFFFLSSCTRNLAHIIYKSQCCKYTLTEPHAPTMHVHTPSTANAFSGRKDWRSVQGSFFSRIDALLGVLEWEVESTTVTHSSVDWWDLLLPLPWHRHQIEGTNGFYCLIRKTLASGVNGIAKVPKRKVFTEVGLEPSTGQPPDYRFLRFKLKYRGTGIFLCRSRYEWFL